MHVVVTGAAGFIGSHTCERLVDRGHRVTAVDVFDDFLYPAAIKRRTAQDLEDRVRFVEGDICDAGTLERSIDDSVDVVCHLAALAGVRPSIAAPMRYWRANVEGTGMLLERMRAVGCKRLVFASSSSVYGARERTTAAFEEREPCVTPASPYAASKRMNELQLSTYRDLFGIGAFALRYFTVYGPRQRPEMAIAVFVRAISQRQPITLYGDGSTRRDYTFIDDIVDGTVAAIERVTPGQLELVNLGGTRTTSLIDLVRLIERVVDVAAEIRWAPEQPGDVPITFANVDRARALLGYEPSTTIEDGVARYWEWIQRR